MTDEIAVLAELFPVLNRVREIASLPRLRLENLALQQVRRLASDALRNLLCRMCENTKLVCFIDDLQWGDAGSAELEYELPQYECQLQPLSQAECIELVVEIVGEDSESIRQRAAKMAEETGGNPFLLAELARYYDPLSTSVQATQMEEVLERKLSLLPAEARELLNVVVVSGHAIAAGEATKTAGYLSVPLATLARMRSERLLRMVGDDENMMIDTYHDRIRETVLRDMETQTRTDLHVQLAETILVSRTAASTPIDPDVATSDQRTDPRVYDLAYHFYEAGDDRAFGYLLKAGEAAMHAYAMDNAIGHFEKAAEIIPEDCNTSTRYQLWERMGQACGKANRMRKAVEHYQTAGAYASGPIERATALCGIGDLQNRMGEFDKSIAALDAALRELGYSRSNRLPWILAETSWLGTLCHTIWIVRPHRRDEDRRRAEIAADIYHNISLVMTAEGDVLRYSHCCIKFAFTAIRSGSAEQIALGSCALSYNHALTSFGFASKWMLKRAARFADRCTDRSSLTVVQTQGHAGISLYLLGQLDEAERRLLASLQILDRVGDSFLRMVFHHHLRHVYAARGDSQKEMAAAEVEFSISEAVSDFETMCWAEYGLADACARMGKTAEAIEHAERSLAVIDGRGRYVSEAIALNHYGFVLLQASEYSRAREVLERSRQIIEKKFLYLEYLVSTYPRLAESALGPNWQSPPAADALRLAKRSCRMGTFFGWRFPNVRPLALRARGRLHAAMGHPSKARSCFEQSIKHARRLGAEYEVARALLDLAVVSEDRGADLRREANSILDRLQATIPHAEAWQLGAEPIGVRAAIPKSLSVTTRD